MKPKEEYIVVACLSCGSVGKIPKNWEKLECPKCKKPTIFPVKISKTI